MQILECSSRDPLDVSAWSYRGMLNHSLPGLDGEPVVLSTLDPQAATVVLRDNGKTIAGQLYFAYSHNNVKDGGGTQELHLVRLVEDVSEFREFDADANQTKRYNRVWAAAGEAPIAVPMMDWEGVRCTGCGFKVNEGPTALYGPTKTFLLYSASFCATPYYAIGMLEFAGVGSGFPFLWIKHPHPAFSGDVFDSSGALAGVRRDAFGVGHNSVTVSRDLSEQWIIYHAKTEFQEGVADREARMQRFAWRADGRPDFGEGPVGGGALILPPSESDVYAVVCQLPGFKGRFCVGLPAPGRYDAAELATRGVDLAAVRSVRLHGGAAVVLHVAESPPGEPQEWLFTSDVARIPAQLAGNIAAVRVLPAPAHVVQAGSAVVEV